MTSTDDPIGKYQDALRSLEGAELRAELVVKRVQDGAQKLRDWRGVTVSNLGVTFPPIRTSISGTEWPDGMQLAQALSAYHDAQHVARDAWSAIPANRRTGLQPPPDPGKPRAARIGP